MPDEKDRDRDKGASPPDKATSAAGASHAQPATRSGAFNDPARSAPLGGPRRDAPGGRPASEAQPAAPQVDPAVIAAATAAAVAAIQKQRADTAPTPNMDKTVPGGLYIVDGKVVDAHGNERQMPSDEELGGGDEPSPAPAPAPSPAEKP